MRMKKKCDVRFNELRTEEESKLSQILNQQRRYQQQLQQQHTPQEHHHRQHHQLQQQQKQQHNFNTGVAGSSAGISSSAPLLSRVANGSQILDVAGPVEDSSGSSVGAAVVDGGQPLAQSERVQAWADPAALNVLSQGGRNTDDLRLQDVSNDCDARSSVSLLESDSVYLPFNIPASPVVLRRPFTAPERKPPEVGKHIPTNTTAAIASSAATGYTSHLHRSSKPVDTFLGQRPQTSSGSHTSPAAGESSSRYDTLEQRPIRPLNQQLARSAAILGAGGACNVPGSSRPSFEIARPLSSSSEPSVVVRSHHSKEGPALPTSLACSQDYESSGEQTTGESESESATVRITTSGTSLVSSNQVYSQPSQLSVNPSSQSPIPIPQAFSSQDLSSSSDGNSHVKLTPSTKEKLNHIRSVAGSRRTAAGTVTSAVLTSNKAAALRDKAAAVARIRDGIPVRREASGSATSKSSTLASCITTSNSSTTTTTTTNITATTVSSTVTASSLAASAVMRAHKLKSTTRQSATHHSRPDAGGGDGSQPSSAFMKNYNTAGNTVTSSGMLKKNTAYHSGNQNHGLETKDTETTQAGSGGMVASHLGGGDSKEVKSRLNQERMEQQKEDGGPGGVRDSGFLSRPPSEVVKEEPQHIDNQAATSIQAFWRGYWAREYNTQVVSARKEIRARRAEDHIMLLRNDLEKNRKLYEEEKRLRILQMEAIKILYHEVQALKSQSAATTNDLNKSGQQLQQPQAALYSPSNTSTVNSGDQGSPLAMTKGSVLSFHPVGGGFGLTSTGNSSLGYTGYSSGPNSELNRTHELERTCASLQSQVSQLHEALESVSSAVFRTNSLEGASLDLTDLSDTIRVTPYTESQTEDYSSSDETSHWCCIPHSLSPYPSEEEEQYYTQVPVNGAPTPPRRLTLRHHSRSALLLSWQPSSCTGHRGGEEEEGNRHIIGYRVFVNDQLKAFIYQKTCALVEGLDSSMAYKFYVKALSGFGESFESNYRIAKLAKGVERYHKIKQPSSDDSAHDSDSDKDLDSTENNSDKQRKRNRKMRKSPRLGGEKRKSSGKGSSHRIHHPHHHHHHHYGERLSMSPRSDSEIALNQNANNSVNVEERSSPLAILRHPKLHTRSTASSKGPSSKERTLAKESHVSDTATTTSKEPSPVAGSAGRSVVTNRETAETEGDALAGAGAVSGKSGSRRLPDSPKLKSPENNHVSGSNFVFPSALANNPKHAGRGEDSKNLTDEVANEQHKVNQPSNSNKPRSPLSGSQRKESSTQNLKHERNKGGSRHLSPQVSPSCGSSEIDMAKPAKSSPQPGSDPACAVIITPTPPIEGGIPCPDRSGNVHDSQSLNMSETFTVDKASSFLESVSANAGRGHRRTRSRDLQAEKMALEGIHQADEGDVSLPPNSCQREKRISGESDGKKELERKTSGGSDRKRESEVPTASGNDVSSKARGHRRKRSKDLHDTPISEWQTGSQGEDKKEITESENAVSKVEGKESDGTSTHPESKSLVSNDRPIVLDGRRRHSSGSRPSSPSVTGVIIGGGSEERTRVSVAEIMMEQRRMLNKSSSLNSLSGRSEDGSIARSEISHKRSPSIESLPGSSRADTSKRTISNESLQSGGSSRGEGGGSSSKRTHSSESLLSIRTDTSKQSYSNESLPGSARTESSRRSPSNESLPESIRKESSEQKQQQVTSVVSRTRSNPRRTQSMGSARDIGHQGEAGSSHSRSSNRMSDLLLKLESITKNNSTSVKEKKESLMVKQTSGGGVEDGEGDHAAKHSDEERQRGGRRSRHLSESDTEGGGVSDPGSQLPPRAPSESSSGSHSDDNKHQRRGHRRTPSDHRPPTSLPPEGDPTRPTHSPIIMEGGPMRKTSSSGGSNVLRNQSFHGILPSKHSDTKASPSSNEDISSKPEEQQGSVPAPPQAEIPSRHRSHLRSRSPSPAKSRQPVLSASQLKKHGEGSGKPYQDPTGSN
ncbi:centrosomal protein of 97 kDa [Elysia marginata]|uniref:Centrosomal protein of 97 kDa n=1 Tax=Elysia marginata TaxID=1093978 RepID=A0AAV4JIB8_9GAST|nr:centrosomal protein of 97 kDa [Elysia marginata]